MNGRFDLLHSAAPSNGAAEFALQCDLRPLLVDKCIWKFLLLMLAKKIIIPVKSGLPSELWVCFSFT